MIEPIVFDTSVYINALRNGDTEILSQRNIFREDVFSPLWLSAVVLEELYAGVSDKKSVKVLAKFEKSFTDIRRILIPNQSDWSIAGQILNKIGQKYGFEKIGKARLTNDTLLAMSVARNGHTLLTINKKDFALISEFREFKYQII